MRLLAIAMLVASMGVLGCGKKDGGGDSAKVTDAQIKAACDNMKKAIKSEVRGERQRKQCMEKIRKVIPGGKLATYVACVTAATDENGLVACQRAAHGK